MLTLPLAQPTQGSLGRGSFDCVFDPNQPSQVFPTAAASGLFYPLNTSGSVPTGGFQGPAIFETEKKIYWHQYRKRQLQNQI